MPELRQSRVIVSDKPTYTLPFPSADMVFYQVNIGTDATQLLKPSPKRTSVLLFNTGVVTIIIGKNKQIDSTHGFPLPGGNALTLEGYVGELWVLSTAPVTLGLIELNEGSGR